MFNLIAAVLLFCLQTNDTRSIDTLVICPATFQPVMQRWIDYRHRQGYQIKMITPVSTSFGIRSQIKEVSNFHPLKNIVLVGDAADINAPRHLLLPTGYIAAKVNVLYGSEAEIATDHQYADIDNDGIVDFNLGRIPIDSANELNQFIDRIQKYESAEHVGDWQKRINLIAGAGGFGQMIDNMIEQSVRKIVTELIPAEFDLNMTYASWQSPYCPDPRRFSDVAIDRINEGCLFWVYLGHGHRRKLDPLRLPDRNIKILDCQCLHQMAVNSGAPIAVLLSCYSAAIDDARDGLAESMVKQNGGPVAAISSSRVAMPYAMGIFALEMLDEYFTGDALTIGELMTKSKRQMVQFDPGRSEYHRMVHSIAKSFSPDPELLAAERLEHIHLLHLLGDPLLRLPRPEKIELETSHHAIAGTDHLVSLRPVESGKLEIELTYRRDRFRQRPQRRKNYDPTDTSFQRYQQTYDVAQNLVSSKFTTTVSPGPLSVRIDIPVECSGDCHVKATLSNDRCFAIGACDIFVNRKPQERQIRP